MPLKKYKPTSSARRFQTVSDFSEITRDFPEKGLLAKYKKMPGEIITEGLPPGIKAEGIREGIGLSILKEIKEMFRRV